jgi:hypothetical protein
VLPGLKVSTKILRKTILLTLLVLVASTILVAAYPSETLLARLTVVNRTEHMAYIRLRCLPTFYYLEIQPLSTAVFTVKRSMYQANFRFCNGATRGGRVDLSKNVRVVFVECGTTPCYRVGENVIKIITRTLNFGESEEDEAEDDNLGQNSSQTLSRWPKKR